MHNCSIAYLISDDRSLSQLLTPAFEAAGIFLDVHNSAASFFSTPVSDYPSCLLINSSVHPEGAVDLLGQIKWHVNLRMPVMVLTPPGDVRAAVRCMKHGAFDIIESPVDAQLVISQIRSAMTVDAQRRDRETERAGLLQRIATLTPRERQLLELICQGTPNKNIATVLGISVKTVENHRDRLMTKTQALNAADLVRMAFQAAG